MTKVVDMLEIPLIWESKCVTFELPIDLKVPQKGRKKTHRYATMANRHHISPKTNI